jgi:hypothetical protein
VALSGGGGGGGGDGDSDVAGTWRINQGRWTGEVLNLHSDGSLSGHDDSGNTVSGSYRTSGSGIVINLRWSSGPTRTMTGTVSGNSMRGTFVDSDAPSGSWAAAKN